MVLQESIRAADVASPAAVRRSARGAVKAWLYAVAALIFVMVLVGGATPDQVLQALSEMRTNGAASHVDLF